MLKEKGTVESQVARSLPPVEMTKQEAVEVAKRKLAEMTKREAVCHLDQREKSQARCLSILLPAAKVEIALRYFIVASYS